jgi:formylglycine-generating enzyme required for sulfatase activity
VELANYAEHVGSTTEVGRYPANPWGLYDMAGNVEEWCMDWYFPAEVGMAEQVPCGEKVVKGGSWNKPASFLRCAHRRGKWHRLGSVAIGFRLVWENAPDEGDV